MKLGKLFGKAVRFAKKNPELVMIFAGAVAPRIVRKAGPIIAAASKD